jgi:hypothetical protein
LKHAESKTGESGATESVEDTEYSTMRNKELIYRMDKTSRSAEWMWDKDVFATNSRKTMCPLIPTMCPLSPIGHKSWLVDSVATTHVSITTKMMTSIAKDSIRR